MLMILPSFSSSMSGALVKVHVAVSVWPLQTGVGDSGPHRRLLQLA